MAHIQVIFQFEPISIYKKCLLDGLDRIVLIDDIHNLLFFLDLVMEVGYVDGVGGGVYLEVVLGVALEPVA